VHSPQAVVGICASYLDNWVPLLSYRVIHPNASVSTETYTKRRWMNRIEPAAGVQRGSRQMHPERESGDVLLRVRGIPDDSRVFPT
jgi:hypothetical protein